jgi:hypothetical protein
MIGLVKRTSLKINNVNIYSEDKDFVPRRFLLTNSQRTPFFTCAYSRGFKFNQNTTKYHTQPYLFSREVREFSDDRDNDMLNYEKLPGI